MTAPTALCATRTCLESFAGRCPRRKPLTKRLASVAAQRGLHEQPIRPLRTRWRLSTRLGPQQAGYGVKAIARFSAFLDSAEVNIDQLVQVDRAVLERYLADLHHEWAGRVSHLRHIGQLNAFFDAIRRHGWYDTLPATATFHAEDYPKQPSRLPRALPEHVMAQIEDPANLDRWDNPA